MLVYKNDKVLVSKIQDRAIFLNARQIFAVAE